jgi:plasmid stability protein
MIKQITLRQVPDAVERGIRTRAKRTNRSLNRAMIDLMEEALGVKSTEKKKRDFSRLAGQWSQEEGETFERNTQVFERIDEETWKP